MALFFVIFFVIIVFGGIAIANGLGVWHTESSKIPMLVKEGEFLAKDLQVIYGETQEGIEIGTGAIQTFVACYIGMN